MKKLNTWPLFLIIGLVLSFTSCKKSTTGTEDDSVSASDNTTVSTGINNMAEDGSNAADNVSIFSRSSSGLGLNLICGSIDSTGTNSVTITYDGSTVCNGITRTGNITVALTSGSSWSAVGAVITVTVNNVVVSDPSTKAIEGQYTINGSFTITNEDGGTIANLILNQNDSLVRRHKGSMQITFANNTTRTWTFDRTFTWTIANISGQTVVNLAWSTQASGGIESSGTNRFNVGFTNTIDSVIQVNTYACSGLVRLAPYVGEYTHSVDNRTVSIQFGTNNSGVSQDNPADCTILTYGWYIRYQDSKTGVSASLFWPYWSL